MYYSLKSRFLNQSKIDNNSSQLKFDYQEVVWKFNYFPAGVSFSQSTLKIDIGKIGKFVNDSFRLKTSFVKKGTFGVAIISSNKISWRHFIGQNV